MMILKVLGLTQLRTCTPACPLAVCCCQLFKFVHGGSPGLWLEETLESPPGREFVFWLGTGWDIDGPTPLSFPLALFVALQCFTH